MGGGRGGGRGGCTADRQLCLLRCGLTETLCTVCWGPRGCSACHSACLALLCQCLPVPAAWPCWAARELCVTLLCLLLCRWQERLYTGSCLAHKRVDTLMLDTTYALPRHTFPPQAEAVSSMVQVRLLLLPQPCQTPVTCWRALVECVDSLLHSLASALPPMQCTASRQCCWVPTTYGVLETDMTYTTATPRMCLLSCCRPS